MRLLQALSGKSAGSSAKLEVLIRCEGWSTARRALSLIDQQREFVIAKGEEISGSYDKAADYIARHPAHSGGLWQDLAGTAAIGSCSPAAKPVFFFYSTP